MTTHPRSTSLLLLLSVTVGGCATQQMSQPSFGSNNAVTSVAPMLAVERFMQAANAMDLEAMAQVFGTYQGPITGDRIELERWMEALGNILQHDNYEIISDRRAVGREYPTIRIGVNITKGRQLIEDVSFMVVESSAGQWLVEEIDVERITSG